MRPQVVRGVTAASIGVFLDQIAVAVIREGDRLQVGLLVPALRVAHAVFEASEHIAVAVVGKAAVWSIDRFSHCKSTIPSRRRADR